jgi:hypothetical protein
MMTRADPLARMLWLEAALRLIRLLRDDWERNDGKGYSQTTRDYCCREISMLVFDQRSRLRVSDRGFAIVEATRDLGSLGKAISGESSVNEAEEQTPPSNQ